MEGQPVVQPAAQPTEVKPEAKIVRPVEEMSKKKKLKEILGPALIIIAIILAGAVTGYLLATRGVSRPTTIRELEEGVEVISGSEEVGIKDERTFRDSAQGRIEVNDSEVVTEGSHKLIRPGGESKTAYLSSSVINLNQFLGKCVEVWGETFAAQQAGWLMDVGRVKILSQCPEGL